MLKRNAFTLAEVLITLGIIGVVAAMTMPTLLNSTQGAQYKTAYKKALSVLSQAIVMNVALDDYDAGQATSTGTGDSDLSVYNILKNRMNIAKISDGTGTDVTIWESGNTRGSNAAGEGIKAEFNKQGNYTFFFNDGIVITFDKDINKCGDGATLATLETNKCVAALDVNGPKKPNTMTECSNNNATEENCEVTHPYDIYTVYFEDQAIKPYNNPSKAVMYTSK